MRETFSARLLLHGVALGLPSRSLPAQSPIQPYVTLDLSFPRFGLERNAHAMCRKVLAHPLHLAIEGRARGGPSSLKACHVVGFAKRLEKTQHPWGHRLHRDQKVMQKIR